MAAMRTSTPKAAYMMKQTSSLVMLVWCAAMIAPAKPPTDCTVRMYESRYDYPFSGSFLAVMTMSESTTTSEKPSAKYSTVMLATVSASLLRGKIEMRVTEMIWKMAMMMM